MRALELKSFECQSCSMLSRDVKRLILRVHLDLCFCMGHCFTSHWESAPIGMLFEYMFKFDNDDYHI